MNKILNQILLERKMVTVDRLSGTHKIKRYSLAEHSYFVALLFQILAEEEKIEYSLKDFSLIMRHDLIEVITSDLIFPVKNFSEKTEKAWGEIEQELYNFNKEKFLCLPTDKSLEEELPPLVFHLFKDCDMLELLLFCYEEEKLGSKVKTVRIIIEALTKSLEDSAFNSVRRIIGLLKETQEVEI